MYPAVLIATVPSNVPSCHLFSVHSQYFPTTLPENTLMQHLCPYQGFLSFDFPPLCSTCSASLCTQQHRKGSLSEIRFLLTIIGMGNNCHWLKMTPNPHPMWEPVRQAQIQPFFYWYYTKNHGHFTLNNHWELSERLKSHGFGLFSTQEHAATLKHTLDCLKPCSAHRSASPCKSC